MPPLRGPGVVIPARATANRHCPGPERRSAPWQSTRSTATAVWMRVTVMVGKRPVPVPAQLPVPVPEHARMPSPVRLPVPGVAGPGPAPSAMRVRATVPSAMRVRVTVPSAMRMRMPAPVSAVEPVPVPLAVSALGLLLFPANQELHRHRGVRPVRGLPVCAGRRMPPVAPGCKRSLRQLVVTGSVVP